MFDLKPFQEKAVSDLVKQSRALILAGGTDKKFVFKSPTGSGKTIMIAEWLNRIAKEEFSDDLVFVWVSLYDLHSQSSEKISNYLRDSRYQITSLDEINESALRDHTILFVNWHSLTTQKLNEQTGEQEWANVFVRDREDGRSITSVLEKTRLEGKSLVLIVDEAHRNYLSESSQKFISQVLQPKLTMEISATPIFKIDPEDLANRNAGYVSVPFSAAVDSGLIKQQTLINQNVGEYVDLANSADELVLLAALKKREQLADSYKSTGVRVNPLVLIQLPSETNKTSALDTSVREAVEALLLEKGISYENGKLAVWLADEKRHLDLIEKNDSPVEVLIFKEAVAVGWDCPRAQILVMLRSIRSITFEIQTVGRILRMPEAKHYEIPELNTAFVFTNVSGINIKDRPEELDFFKTNFSKLKSSVSGVALPSHYLHRQDYGDLTARFSTILIEELNRHFGITDADTSTSAYEKADEQLELYPEELQMPILSDVMVRNVDAIQEEIGTFDLGLVQINVSEANIQREFDYILKAWCLPYAPVRSFSKLKTGLYKWFGIIGYSSTNWTEVQRVVACSAKNQDVFSEVIARSKDRYEAEKAIAVPARQLISNSTYSPPSISMSGEQYEKTQLEKYGYEPAFLSKKRSNPEKQLEAALEASPAVDWWIKNGEGQQQFLSIVYGFTDPESGISKQANFYPDFIVKFKDGSIGIYETKSGITITDHHTYGKSDALQNYLKVNANLQVRGGIVNSSGGGLTVFLKPKYNPINTEWDPLVL